MSVFCCSGSFRSQGCWSDSKSFLCCSSPEPHFAKNEGAPPKKYKKIKKLKIQKFGRYLYKDNKTQYLRLRLYDSDLNALSSNAGL